MRLTAYHALQRGGATQRALREHRLCTTNTTRKGKGQRRNVSRRGNGGTAQAERVRLTKHAPDAGHAAASNRQESQHAATAAETPATTRRRNDDAVRRFHLHALVGEVLAAAHVDNRGNHERRREAADALQSGTKSTRQQTGRFTSTVTRRADGRTHVIRQQHTVQTHC